MTPRQASEVIADECELGLRDPDVEAVDTTVTGLQCALIALRAIASKGNHQ